MNLIYYLKKFNRPEKILWYAGRNTFLRYVSDELYLKIAFKAYLGYPLDLENPRTFNEKLQWLKLHDKNPLYTKLVDKYEVKRYVREKIGNDAVARTINVWNSADDIDFRKLPSKFVLKCTHDSGGVIICKDRNRFNADSARRKLKKSLQNDYFLEGREWPYKHVPPRIIAEEYLESACGSDIIDYKFLCYGGKVKNIFTCTERFKEDGSSGELKVTFFDRKWNRLPFERKYRSSRKEIPRPKNLEQMIAISEKLSEGIPFVRIDLYDVDGHIYFGEFTFYPGGGLEWFRPFEWDYRLGKLINIKNI